MKASMNSVSIQSPEVYETRQDVKETQQTQIQFNLCMSNYT